MGSATYIICTQPRRLSAISLAERVREEITSGPVVDTPRYRKENGHVSECTASLAEKETNATTEATSTSTAELKGICSYEVRLKSNMSKKTRILYCTTGILLRKLLSPDFLKNVSHIILDEVHERQVEMDFLCAILKGQINSNPHLKIILMSATLEESKFVSYFGSTETHLPRVLHIPGRMYPVQIRYIHEASQFMKKWGRLKTKPRSDSSVDILPLSIDQEKHGSASLLQESHFENISLISQGDQAIAPPPVIDAKHIVELIKCIINKHQSENSHQFSYLSENKIVEGAKGQAILVFLPGLQSIRRVEIELNESEYYKWLGSAPLLTSSEIGIGDFKLQELHRERLRTCGIQIYTLHSSVSPEQQRRVFAHTKVGEWKIILSTNIAETSVTIDDITHVIDTG